MFIIQIWIMSYRAIINLSKAPSKSTDSKPKHHKPTNQIHWRGFSLKCFSKKSVMNLITGFSPENVIAVCRIRQNDGQENRGTNKQERL